MELFNNYDSYLNTRFLDEDLSKSVLSFFDNKSDFDIQRDIRLGKYTGKQLMRALLNSHNLKFPTSKSGETPTVKIKLENGVEKEYDMYTVATFMKNYINHCFVEPLSLDRLCYIWEYNPDYELPDNADIHMISSKIIHRKKMFEDGIKEGIANGEDEARMKYDLYKSDMYCCYTDIFLIANACSRAFSQSPFSKEINDYVLAILYFSTAVIWDCDFDKSTMMQCISIPFRKHSSNFDEVIKTYNIGVLTDDEVINYIEAMGFTKDELEVFLRSGGESIVDRKKVVKYLTSSEHQKDDTHLAGIITPEEFKANLNQDFLNDMYKYTKNREFLSYMLPENIIKNYSEGLIADSVFGEVIKLDEIIDATVSSDTKIKTLERCGKNNLFNGDRSVKLWSLVENGAFSIENIKKLEKFGFISVESIINQYTENMKRKIAGELGELSQISDSKLFEYFTPDIILRELSKNNNAKVQHFIKSILEKIYEEQGYNMEDGLSDELAKEDKQKAVEHAISLYKSGFVNIDILKNMELTEEDALKICNDSKDDEQLLIDMYNSGLVSQLAMFEQILDLDTDLACTLIGKGMKADVIKGMFTTTELIEMTRSAIDEDGNEIPAKLSYANLVELKDDIDTGINEKGISQKDNDATTLLELYLSDRLSYSELYDLVKADVISINVANMINEKYNLIKDWSVLKDKGVEGKSILDMTIPGPGPNPTESGDAVGIDEDCIIDLYLAMGAKEYLEIDSKQCPVFKDYIIIPIIEKKVAYLESNDGRTYIVPLKIVLEQINDPNGQMDLIGNARSRKEFNRQKLHIRSANHTKNWGRNVVQKTAELPSVPMSKEDSKEFISSNYGIITAIENSYDARKLAMKKQKSGHQKP